METTHESYIVKTNAFEGPLGLLLELIESRKFFINDIALADVAGDYLAKIKEKTYPVAQASSFLVIAATLILLKTKSLLPNIELTEEENESVDMLERRLRAYKLVKETSALLVSMFGETILYAPQERRKSVAIIFAPHEKITTANMATAATEVIARFIKDIAKPEVTVEKTINIAEIIDNVRNRIERAISNINFSEVIRDAKEQVTIIVSFLAVLELVREGLLEVEQESHESDISITKRDIVHQ